MSAAPSSDILVSADDLEKRFVARRGWAASVRQPFARRYVQVLRGVSLRVHRGEFFGLLGPNGAGKTTLFKVLSTLVLPDAGRAEVAGVDVVAHPERVRRLLTPVMADERSLFWRLNGRENLRLFASLHGLSAPAADARTRELLDLVGLSHAADRMAGTYSSGMKQRLLIARALLSRPAVLLLDEPTRSLDPVSARDFRRFLREEIVGRQGCTVLLATHDADEAFDLCDRLAVLDEGRIVATGTASELAHAAGVQRYRAVVAAPHAQQAVATLAAAGWPTFRATESHDAPWTELEGELPGSNGDTVNAVQRLVAGGVGVAEFARVPLSLADLVEQLIARGRAS